ncbi:helix-turn-helix domain-containing protein [Streptomyces lunaelactis]|nr:helix-turn-helix domain-containing protein [Streptomyces lunaelactis]
MVLDPDDRCVHEERVRAHTTPQRAARRAHIVLLTAGGCPAWRIAEIVRVDVSTVERWRDRYAREGLAGLEDRPRSGRPPVYGPEVRLRIVAAATSTPPHPYDSWSHRLIAGHLADTGISASQIGRILAALQVKPHRVRGWLTRARRPELLHQGRRGVRPLPQMSAGLGGGVGGREDRDGRPLPQASRPAARPRAGASAGVRVRSPRHRLGHRRARCAYRAGRRGRTATQRLRALHQVPGPAGEMYPGRADDPPGPGQRCLAHLPGHPGLAGEASTDRAALHAQARLVAEPGGDLLLPAGPRRAASRGLHLPGRPASEGHRLRHRPQRDRSPVPLELPGTAPAD